MYSNRLLLFSFVLAIIAGGVLLALPISSTGEAISLVDAFFLWRQALFA